MNDNLMKNLKSGIFTSNKNRVWTMCQCALKLCTLAMEEAEKGNLTDEQFYISWEDALNIISVKDHNNKDITEFANEIKNFYADSGRS